MGFAGLLIRRERLKRDWSQKGLCSGICTISYLSKIEQGKAEPSQEVLTLLLDRLGVTWHTGEIAQRAQNLAEALFDAFCSMDDGRERELLQELARHREAYVNSAAMLDLLILEPLCAGKTCLELKLFVPVMDERQQGLWLLLEERCEEAFQLLPLPVTCALAGQQDYQAGRYSRARQRLQRAFDQAAEQCRPHLMLFCRTILGNCASDLNDYPDTLYHYTAAERLAKALGEEQYLRDIRYNLASTQMQFGRYEEAYGYFRQVEAPTIMDLHKLAICCEGLGRGQEALATLDRAENADSQMPHRELALSMCHVVRYRLEHPDYLKDEIYGAMLVDCMTRLRKELPVGYAAFHLPWMEEWYTANRQYKQALELLKEFPEGVAFCRVKSQKTGLIFPKQGDIQN